MKKYTEPNIEMIEYFTDDIIAASYYVEEYSDQNTSSEVVNPNPETPIDDGPITDLDNF